MDTRRFTPLQIHALANFAAEYVDTFKNFEDAGDACVSAGKMFAATLDVILDPGASRDCLGWREAGPLVAAGLDLADERVQEDVLAYVLEKVRDRDRWLIV